MARQRGIGKQEVEKAISRLKCGRLQVLTEMLRYGCEVIVDWML